MNARNAFGPRLVILALLLLVPQTRGADLGLFEEEAEIGRPSQAGSVAFDPATQSFVVTGGGENMWFTNDAFHFVWKRTSGDFSLDAAIEWLGTGGNPHRKACLIVRQNLAPDSPYVDVAVHGDGLTSLQYREIAGGPTREIQAAQPRPKRAGLGRQGDTFFMQVPAAAEGQPLQPGGAFMRLRFNDPVYVGLAVCAHDDKVAEKARFNQVSLAQRGARSGNQPQLHSSLETIAIASKDRRIVYHTLDPIEAPNWSRDGLDFVFNARGHLFRLPAAGGIPQPIDSGFADQCTSAHGPSPDGEHLAITDQSRGGNPRIYLLPVRGGEPRAVTSAGPSHWHGWSPDGSRLVYAAERNREHDIYTIAVAGGEERRLTSATGLNDNPDYTPDGKFIYFNSDRSGTMQIWRMNPEGADPEPVTTDDFANWFPHPSPDGKWLLFLSCDKHVRGRPVNQPVRLRLMPRAGGAIQELARLVGGQGTIDVPCWSPDSRQVTFISYELIER